MVFVS